MSKGYLHECERAELLGLPVPSEEEWNETQKLELQTDVNDEDDITIQNLEISDETAQRVGGGLDELNSILNATQKKINRFKTVCGSLSTLLKVKVGSRNNTPDHKPTEPNPNVVTESQAEASGEEENVTVELSDGTKNVEIRTNTTTTQKKSDINEKMESHLDKLDSLINKAENAQYSMQHQSKQMRKILK